ncbi:MAG: sulfur oxidation c-type cytochrome SoxX [Magnetovibrionaceae bacterium]
MTKRLIARVAGSVLALGLGIGAAQAEGVADYKIVDDSEIPASLTGKPGNAESGKKVFVNRKLGNCLACHALTELSDQPFHGQVAPSLDEVADRYSEAELRLRVVNPKVINPDTMMPAYHRTKGLHMVKKNFADKPILTAEQVEDLLAYLVTLK